MQTPCWPANSSELGKCPQPKCRLEQAHECLSHTGTSLVLFPAVLPHSPPLVLVRSTVPGKADHRFVGQRSIWRELSCVNDRLRKQPDLPRKLFQAAARARFWMLAFPSGIDLRCVLSAQKAAAGIWTAYCIYGHSFGKLPHSTALKDQCFHTKLASLYPPRDRRTQRLLSSTSLLLDYIRQQPHKNLSVRSTPQVCNTAGVCSGSFIAS